MIIGWLVLFEALAKPLSARRGSRNGVENHTMIPKSITDRLESNDRGVSPVIGVILMVAITVILAAVIGTFVLDLGQSAGNSAPSASLTVSLDAGANETAIAHKGGDSLVASQTRLIVANESGDGQVTFEGGDDPDSFSVGDTVTVNTTTNPAVQDSVWSTQSATSNPSDTFEIQSGNQYSVQLIDLESQRVIFETTVTA